MSQKTFVVTKHYRGDERQGQIVKKCHDFVAVDCLFRNLLLDCLYLCLYVYIYIYICDFTYKLHIYLLHEGMGAASVARDGSRYAMKPLYRFCISKPTGFRSGSNNHTSTMRSSPLLKIVLRKTTF